MTTPDLSARPRWYVLDGHTAHPAASVIAWAEWFSRQPHACLVNQAMVGTGLGAVLLKTRFTGIDRALAHGAPPILFETSAHVGDSSLILGERSTWAEAQEFHAMALRTLHEADAFASRVSSSLAANQAQRSAVWLALCRAVMRRAAPFSNLPDHEDMPPCRSD